jgi:hypothetical protein
MNTASASRIAWAASVSKKSRPALTLLAISASSPGSKIGMPPARSCAIFCLSLSMQVTTWPKSAKQAPLTRPT